MTNEFNQKTALRTRRMPFRPAPEGDADHGTTVLPVGTHLGEFEILDLIGEGGFGIVYLAYDHSLERQVALKEYMPSGLARRTTKLGVTVRSEHNIETFTAGLKSFINEARILAQFDSPSLVKVHRFWEGNGTAYMVMPFYDGITLKQALKQRRITPSEPWLRILLADLFDAIEIIHRAQCLHRDIAPDNILLLKDGRPLLLDFGAARRVIGDLTQCLTAILKPGYAPIEQYADIAGLRQGPWTDIYALAAVVYYLIAGKAPPPAVARMVHDELVPAREIGKGRYNNNFLAALDKALEVKPEQRYRSIAELRRALDIMQTAPRTLTHDETSWTTTVMQTAPIYPGNVRTQDKRPKTRHETRPDPQPDFMPDLKTRIAAPSQPERQAQQPQAGKRIGFAIPPLRVKREWLVLGVLLTAGIASGIYLGNRTGDAPTPPATPPVESTTPPPGTSGTSGPDEQEQVAEPDSSSRLPPVTEVTPPASPTNGSEKLRRDQAALREDELWRQASNSAEASGYKKYLREFPQGRYATTARLMLESKQPKADARTAEDEVWMAVIAANEAPAYESYLRKYPKGRYAPQAKDRLASFNKPPTPPAPAAKPPVVEQAPAPAQSTNQDASEPAPAERKPDAPEQQASIKPEPPATATPKQSVEESLTKQPVEEPLAKPSIEESPTKQRAEESLAKQSVEESLAKQPAEKQPADTLSGKKQLVVADQTMIGDFSADPKTGIVSGTGKVIWSNGDQFEGTLVKGKKEGKGKFIWHNGQRYTGDWARDMPNGKGVIVFTDGSRYEGDVKDGMPHGQGTTRFKSGDVYSGIWVRGKSNGHGRYTWANGSYWEGEFKDDKRTDNGKMVFADAAKNDTANAAASSGMSEMQGTAGKD